MNLVFDLDGTLLDSKLRLYQLIKDLAPELPLSMEQYWVLKRNKISNESILASKLGYTKSQLNDFFKTWMSLIETPKYLELDSVYAGVHILLERLQLSANLYLCTDRQFLEPVHSQLDSHKLSKFFKKILVTRKMQSKESLISNGLCDMSETDWVIGDTGKDIEVGRSLNIKSCAVSNGFLSKRILELYKPDLMLDSVSDFYIP